MTVKKEEVRRSSKNDFEVKMVDEHVLGVAIDHIHSLTSLNTTY